MMFSMKIHDFLDGFWCIAMAIRAFLDVRFPKKRLAWIRTHARLRLSFSGLETVVVTTSPQPRLRVKGGHIEAMSNRTRVAIQGGNPALDNWKGETEFPFHLSQRVLGYVEQISKARFPPWIHVSLPSVFWVRFLREASGSSTLRIT